MLMRFDPFRELDRLPPQSLGGAGFTGMPLDAYRHGDQFIVHVDVPGVDPASIELTVEQNVLSVSAERSGRGGDGEQVVIAERPQGRVTRQLFLGEGLDADRIEASCEDGVLTVTVPVAERAKPRKVQVGGGQSRREAIDARSSQSPGQGAERKEPANA